LGCGGVGFGVSVGSFFFRSGSIFAPSSQPARATPIKRGNTVRFTSSPSGRCHRQGGVAGELLGEAAREPLDQVLVSRRDRAAAVDRAGLLAARAGAGAAYGRDGEAAVEIADGAAAVVFAHGAGAAVDAAAGRDGEPAPAGVAARGSR